MWSEPVQWPRRAWRWCWSVGWTLISLYPQALRCAGLQQQSAPPCADQVRGIGSLAPADTCAQLSAAARPAAGTCSRSVKHTVVAGSMTPAARRLGTGWLLGDNEAAGVGCKLTLRRPSTNMTWQVLASCTKPRRERTADLLHIHQAQGGTAALQLTLQCLRATATSVLCCPLERRKIPAAPCVADHPREAPGGVR